MRFFVFCFFSQTAPLRALWPITAIPLTHQPDEQNKNINYHLSSSPTPPHQQNNQPQGAPNERPQEGPQGASEEDPQEAPQGAPQEAPIEGPQGAPQGAPQAGLLGAPQEGPEGSPKERVLGAPKEGPQEGLQGPTKEVVEGAPQEDPLGSLKGGPHRELEEPLNGWGPPLEDRGGALIDIGGPQAVVDEGLSAGSPISKKCINKECNEIREEEKQNKDKRNKRIDKEAWERDKKKPQVDWFVKQIKNIYEQHLLNTQHCKVHASKYILQYNIYIYIYAYDYTLTKIILIFITIIKDSKRK